MTRETPYAFPPYFYPISHPFFSTRTPSLLFHLHPRFIPLVDFFVKYSEILLHDTHTRKYTYVHTQMYTHLYTHTHTYTYLYTPTHGSPADWLPPLLLPSVSLTLYIRIASTMCSSRSLCTNNISVKCYVRIINVKGNLILLDVLKHTVYTTICSILCKYVVILRNNSLLYIFLLT